MAEHMRQITRADSVLICARCWVGIHIAEHIAALCTFFIFILSLTFLHLFTIVKHYFVLIFQYGVTRCLFLQFFIETQFWSFYLILFKRLPWEISFSNFVYLLLDRITFPRVLTKFSRHLPTILSKLPYWAGIRLTTFIPDAKIFRF